MLGDDFFIILLFLLFLRCRPSLAILDSLNIRKVAKGQLLKVYPFLKKTLSGLPRIPLTHENAADRVKFAAVQLNLISSAANTI